MFPRPYKSSREGIYSGGQQFGTLPNPSAEDLFYEPQISPEEFAAGREYMKRRTARMQGAPVADNLGVSPETEARVRQWRNRGGNQPAPPPGRVEYQEPQSQGFDSDAINQYMMGRYLNNTNMLDRNMRMRDERVRQADADNGVDRFFSRVVAPIGIGVGGIGGSDYAMETMDGWQKRLDNNIQRNRQFQAAHINDTQANQVNAFNQAMANDPRAIKNQEKMMRAYAYSQGIMDRNRHYERQDDNSTTKIGNQKTHWDNQDTTNSRKADIQQQRANTDQEYKRGQLKVNQQNADTRSADSSERSRHNKMIEGIAQKKLDEVIRVDSARIEKIYDDMATGAVNRQKGMAQIDKIYADMDAKQEQIQLGYDRLAANIENNQANRDQRDRAEAGKNYRAASAQYYDKSGKPHPKMDEGFRAQYGKPIEAPPERRSDLLTNIRARPKVVAPQRKSSGLVPPPPAVPIRRGGGQMAALRHYRELPDAYKRFARQQFVEKYGVDPEG